MAATRKPKGQYHHGDLRRALLDAALDLLRRGEDVGLREVARRAGVSHAAPYRHFADKEALLGAVAEEGFLALTKAIRGASDATAAGKARFFACGTAYVQFAVDHPAHYRVMFGPAAMTAARKNADAFQAAGREAFGEMLRLIEEMQVAGLMRPDPPLQIAVTLWSMEHGLAMLELDGQVDILPSSTVAERAHLVHETLLTGLAPAAGAGKARPRAARSRSVIGRRK